MSRPKGDWMTPEQRSAFNKIAATKAKASGRANRWTKEEARAAAKKAAEKRKAKRKLSNLKKNAPPQPEIPTIEIDPSELP
mgnify:CR=1 FL=1